MIVELMEVIVYVRDMEAQVRFYRDVLGLAVTYPAGLASYAGQSWVTLNTGACTLALHGGGSGSRAPDASMIVFRVEDVETARSALLERGADVREVFDAAPGVRVAHALDPEGNPFALEMHTGLGS